MPESGRVPASARVLPGAVSPLTSWLVAGRTRRGVVVGAYRYGVYVEVGGTVLPVLTRDATALPTALRLAVTSDEVGLGVRAGDSVGVGGGIVRMAGVTVRGVRTWRPARVRPCERRRTSSEAVRVLRDAAAGSGWVLAPIAGAVTSDQPDADVSALLGRGQGLTPTGDDALAGALLAASAVAGDHATLLAGAVRRRLAATTAVSAALLDAAADGWAAPEVVALVDAAAAGHARATEALLPPVLAIGHDSGRDLVAGVAAALDTLGSAAPTGRSAA